jgi:hypothetical protein
MFIVKETKQKQKQQKDENETRERETKELISIGIYIYRLITNRYRNKKKNEEGCEDDRCHPLTVLYRFFCICSIP